MSEIVPRWEWRTFGERFGAADERFAALEPERVHESDELYLLSTRSADTVKVRDGLLDVKRLERVGDDGLEQWLPVLKVAFPVPAADAAAALVLDAPLARVAYTLDELLDELVRPDGELRAVPVHKRRQRYSVGGCAAELTEVRTDGAATRTIAVESEDPALVLAAVRGLGLEGRPNTSFPRGLAGLVGFGARRYAVLDVGTNSVKLHLAERSADGAWRTVDDRAEVTRLGEGLDEHGRLDPEPIARTVEAIADMVAEARRDGAAEIAAVGTAGMRIAPNRAELVDAVRDRTGVEIEVIPGEEEARLAYLAAVSGLGLATGSLVVFDTGGGSSQFTFGRGTQVEERFSVDVGAAQFTERYHLDGPVERPVLVEALDAIGAALSRLDGRPAPHTLVGMGGAVTNLAAVKLGLERYDPGAVQGSVLELAEIDRQIEVYAGLDADERREIAGLQPKRAEVILAGACIVHTVLSKLGCESLLVSDRGLRHGLVVERFGA